MSLHAVPAFSVDTLAAALAELLKRRENPLVPETVLIMNFAQRVMLRRAVAKTNGICANIDFKAPDKFLKTLIADAKNGADVGDFFDRNALAWQIFERLKKRLAGTQNNADSAPRETRGNDDFFGLRGKPESEIFFRAVELGDLFWRYQNVRPQMICDWTRNAPEPRGVDDDFLTEFRRQKSLWRELDFGSAVPPALAWKNFLKSKTPPHALPPRIFVFAPSTLPHIHAALLEKLAAHTEIFLCCHNLSSDLWTETRERKALLRERLAAKKNRTDTTENFVAGTSVSDEIAPNESVDDALAETTDDDALALEGNPLLLSWGRAAKPFAERLIELGLLDADSTIDAPPERDSLLHALQRDIRENSPTPQKFVPANAQNSGVPAPDRSLHILAAPNPLREMEILRDELIFRFANDKTLQPGDVIVAFADIETYAPFIRAAFENSGIPFSIADRAGTEIFPTATTFLELLDAARGEFRLDEILALISHEAIRRALGLDDDEALELTKTLSNAGISWGTDADFRRKRIFGNDFPATESPAGTPNSAAATDRESDRKTLRATANALAQNNSWAAGKRRLALGFMCGNEDEIFFNFSENRRAEAGTTAVDRIAETAPRVLGKIFRLVALLAELSDTFSSKIERDVPAWCDFLREKLVDNFLENGNGETEIIRRTLGALGTAARFGVGKKKTASCTLETIFCALEKQDWNTERSGAAGMLRGKLTFCRLQPQRNIPARIICVAGLSDGAFPRAPKNRSLDLTAFPPHNFRNEREATRCDRTTRDDDCLLFLETVLAARDALLLSYVARDARDGSARPPCIPLAKLRDYVAEMLAGTRAETSLETRHKLYGFNAAYFENYAENDVRRRDFFSFSEADFRTAKSAARSADAAETAKSSGAAGTLKIFLGEKIPRELSLSELIEFFKSPARFVCEKTLNAKRNFMDANASGDDPQTTFTNASANDFHRRLLEKWFTAAQRANDSDGNDDSNGNDADGFDGSDFDNADGNDFDARRDASGDAFAAHDFMRFRDEELAAFRARELAAGRSAPLIEKDNFNAALCGKFKDFAGKKGANAPFPSALPQKLSRTGKNDFRFEFSPFPEAFPQLKIAVSARFENLFRDADGALFLALFGNGKFGWNEAVTCLVTAAFLAAAFPNERFRVVHFSGNAVNPKIVSEENLARAFASDRTSEPAAQLVKFFAENFASPPLFFYGLNFSAAAGGNAEEFSEKVLSARNSHQRNDTSEDFIFGNASKEALAENLREKVFPFAEKLSRALEETAKGEKKSADEKSAGTSGKRTRGGKKAGARKKRV